MDWILQWSWKWVGKFCICTQAIYKIHNQNEQEMHLKGNFVGITPSISSYPWAFGGDSMKMRKMWWICKYRLFWYIMDFMLLNRQIFLFSALFLFFWAYVWGSSGGCCAISLCNKLFFLYMNCFSFIFAISFILLFPLYELFWLWWL